MHSANNQVPTIDNRLKSISRFTIIKNEYNFIKQRYKMGIYNLYVHRLYRGILIICAV